MILERLRVLGITHKAQHSHTIMFLVSIPSKCANLSTYVWVCWFWQSDSGPSEVFELHHVVILYIAKNHLVCVNANSPVHGRPMNAMDNDISFCT
jgi:hypothetical protein